MVNLNDDLRMIKYYIEYLDFNMDLKSKKLYIIASLFPHGEMLEVMKKTEGN